MIRNINKQVAVGAAPERRNWRVVKAVTEITDCAWRLGGEDSYQKGGTFPPSYRPGRTAVALGGIEDTGVTYLMILLRPSPL